MREGGTFCRNPPRGLADRSKMNGEVPSFARAGAPPEAALDGDERTLDTIELEWRPSSGPWMLEIGSPDGTSSVRLEGGKSIVLGSARRASFRIADPAVSACHCSVAASAAGVEVTDLGSTNGLFVGGARVEKALLAGRTNSFVIGRSSVHLRPEREIDHVREVRSVPGLVGNSSAMRRAIQEIHRHARLRAPVLLLGESGTGKDVVARALHELSRRPGPLVPLNVGAIPEALADAELFGHQRGAFTGAVAARAGAFEQAHRGTLFLDEIAELTPAMQVRLLRVVEDGSVRPVGGTQAVSVDVRVVSATWAPLRERVEEGRFRADLYHRLSYVVIELPPLRERKSDIPALARALLARSRDELGDKLLSSAAVARLVAHDWPGNVRELKAVLYRASIAAEDEEIGADHVELALPAIGEARGPVLAPARAVDLLHQFRGNVSAAARAARVPRSTFRAWLEKASSPEAPAAPEESAEAT
jgi:transcriptional regulator of acetoin/glycerol metabolism